MRLLHFGFKVHDIERTMRAYHELFGIEWDPVAEFALPRGDDASAAQPQKVTHGKTGDGVEIEIVQYVEGRPSTTW